MRIARAWMWLPFLAGAFASVALAASFERVTATQEVQATASEATPRYTSQGHLIRPQDYREWIYLSSGLGMAYTPNAAYPGNFTNVFVPQAAYHAFLATGKWPDKTMFVLEERAASSNGSINKGGHFQADLAGLAAEVKDKGRFPEKWAYFSFASGTTDAAPNPKTACWDCHNAHAAVENTFVQFYPTLK
ncbi:MAG: cytochrome P460 family protein, partial [Candidatus Acidiferrales bacterium]